MSYLQDVNDFVSSLQLDATEVTFYRDIGRRLQWSLLTEIPCVIVPLWVIGWCLTNARAGNSLIGFPSESLVFSPKNEQMSDSLKKTSDSLIRSFLVSDLSDLLMIAHFLWAMWANRSWSLIFGERPEGFTQIAHFCWATCAIHSHCSPKINEWFAIFK